MEIPDHAPSWGTPGLPLASNATGRMIGRGKHSPQVIGWPHHTYVVHMFYLAYLSVVLFPLSKSMRTKMSEKKSEKNTLP
jgi:hypothetical protein